MSVCVVVKVGEGLVLAADSASSVIGTAVSPDGKLKQQGVMKIFSTSSKLFQIRDLPIGVISWGAGSFRERIIASLVEEFENEEEIVKLERKKLDIKEVANKMWKFMINKSDLFFKDIPKEGRPATGLFICGYSRREFFPEEYVMTVPVKEPEEIRPNKNGNPDFGANWFGLTDAIVRFHHGRDDRIFDILKKHNIAPDIVEKIKNEFMSTIQYPVPFNAMPLGDAIAYAKFLMELTISRYRFVVGAELCTAPVNIAIITPKEGFKPLAKKQYYLEKGD